jgi:cysteinyl-tRNA synthetase
LQEQGFSPVIVLYDTLSGGRKSFDSTKNPEMKIYNCGLTVYDSAHIGHAKTIVFFDLLRRFLKMKGFQVKYVQNFTDVDDKIIQRANELGVSPSDVSERFINEYFRDFDSINVMRADSYPRATEMMDEIIEMVDMLIRKGAAYVTPSGVYLEVSKVYSYGKLSKTKPSELRAGARVEPDPEKKDPLDFALWKVYKDGPLWDSPWGKGRPGWHIECSAMVHKELGEPIEIHGGGEDLIFPHHENEIAQSETLFSVPLAKAWIHVGMLKLSGEKMSKSVGNVVSVAEFVRRWGPNTLRYYLLSNLYRRQLEYSANSLQKARENWRLIEAAKAITDSFPHVGMVNEKEDDSVIARTALVNFDRALSDDMNTPSALSELLKLSRLINTRFSAGLITGDRKGKVLEAFLRIYHTFGFAPASITEQQKKSVEMKVKERNELRRNGDFQQADQIRRELEGDGFALVDHKGGTLWYKSEYLLPG